jgi:hypothetical protein
MHIVKYVTLAFSYDASYSQSMYSAILNLINPNVGKQMLISKVDRLIYVESPYDLLSEETWYIEHCAGSTSPLRLVYDNYQTSYSWTFGLFICNLWVLICTLWVKCCVVRSPKEKKLQPILAMSSFLKLIPNHRNIVGDQRMYCMTFAHAGAWHDGFYEKILKCTLILSLYIHFIISLLHSSFF